MILFANSATLAQCNKSCAARGTSDVTVRIWFHGTKTKRAALAILRQGFHAETYFSAHLEDAVMFGGPYVFEVAMDVAEPTGHPMEGWQLKVREPVLPDRIIALHRYEVTRLSENKDLRAWVAEENRKDFEAAK